MSILEIIQSCLPLFAQSQLHSCLCITNPPFSPQFFRILGDISHTLSKCILIFAIHRNSSAEGMFPRHPHPSDKQPPKLTSPRCLPHNPISLCPRLYNPLPGSLLWDFYPLEFRPQSLLYRFFSLHSLFDVKSVCENQGKRKGLETWWIVFCRKCGIGTDCDDDF